MARRRRRSRSKAPADSPKAWGKAAYRQPDGTIVVPGKLSVLKDGRTIGIMSVIKAQIDIPMLADCLVVDG